VSTPTLPSTTSPFAACHCSSPGVEIVLAFCRCPLPPDVSTTALFLCPGLASNIADKLGKRYTFIIAACCGFVGVLLAFFFVEDKGKDRLEKEDEAWRQYLVDNGYGHLTMGDGSCGVVDATQNRDAEKLEFE